MASYQILMNNRNFQVRDSSSSCYSNIRHGLSTSQMHLHKILRIIASYPPPPPAKEILRFEEKKEGSCCGYRGVGFDLNMEFGPWEVETYRDQSGSLRSDCSDIIKVSSNDSMADLSGGVDGDGGGGGGFVGEKSSSEGECDTPGIQGVEEESGSLEASETENKDMNINPIDEHIKQVNEEENKKEQDSGGEVKAAALCPQQQNHKANDDCLSLLIEAAEMISSRDSKPSVTEEPSHKLVGNDGGGRGGAESSKRREKCPTVEEIGGDFKDVSPVVRSKRGRNQVLPRRYRDSILLEPWKRLPRPPKSTATAAATSNKRKSR